MCYVFLFCFANIQRFFLYNPEKKKNLHPEMLKKRNNPENQTTIYTLSNGWILTRESTQDSLLLKP